MKESAFVLIDQKLCVFKNRDLTEKWHLFECADLNCEAINIKWNLQPYSCYGVQVLSSGKNKNYVLKSQQGILISDTEWNRAELYADKEEDASPLIMLFLYSHLIPKQTLLFHSSLVDLSGSGIMFLGPSGIGKTTQAELWNKYLGADILNGDMVFARKNEDGFYGYGSPWHGSSPYYKNAKVKLKALVVLEQAGENILKRLEGFDVLQGIMEQVFLPHWYPEAMDTCLNTLDLLLEEVPVYHLACRPDEDAVLLLKQELGL